MRNSSRKINWGKVLLWVFFWPFMLIYMIVKSPRFSKKTKVALIGGFVVLVVIMSGLEEREVPVQDDPTEEPPVEEIEDALLLDVIGDKNLCEDLMQACKQIGVAPEKITKVKPAGEWSGGEKYSLTYKPRNTQMVKLVAFCNMNSTVDSINFGDTSIYKRGYEAYVLADYMEDSGTVSQLEILTENYVKSHLNFPKTADFHWLDWTSSRRKSLYYIGGSVTAENAFGVEEDLGFTLVYNVGRDAETLVYFELGGTTLVNDMEAYQEPERKKVSLEEVETGEDGEIILIEGQVGSYGEIVNLDGNETINYVIPTGKYQMTNEGKLATVFVAKDEYYENMDGYMENEIVETIQFSEHGEQAKITVHEGEHLELSVHTSVKLMPQ